jgi:hypothetical protein
MRTYLDIDTFSIDILFTFILRFCPALWRRDITVNLYLVFLCVYFYTNLLKTKKLKIKLRGL